MWGGRKSSADAGVSVKPLSTLRPRASWRDAAGSSTLASISLPVLGKQIPSFGKGELAGSGLSWGGSTAACPQWEDCDWASCRESSNPQQQGERPCTEGQGLEEQGLGKVLSYQTLSPHGPFLTLFCLNPAWCLPTLSSLTTKLPTQDMSVCSCLRPWPFLLLLEIDFVRQCESRQCMWKVPFWTPLTAGFHCVILVATSKQLLLLSMTVPAGGKDLTRNT